MKDKLMTASEMVRSISELTDVPVKKVKDILTEYETIVASELLEKGVVKIGMLGRIKLKVKKQRIAMNLKTNERMIIPAKVLPKFTFSKALNDIISENIKPEDAEEMLKK